jgi:hypothetical protein
MAFSSLLRAFMSCASLIVIGPGLNLTAHAEQLSCERISDSIANQLTTTIPLKQCQYPRFWPHTGSAIRGVGLLENWRDPPRERHRKSAVAATSSLREAPTPFSPIANTSTIPLVPSESTTNLFHRISEYFAERGYETPTTLTIIYSKAPNAFVRRGREVVLTSAIMTQVTEPSELAFVLAHEAAHVALGHHARGGIAAEVAADTLALNALVALGFNPCSGSSVLERLGAPAQVTLVSLSPRLDALHDQTSSFCG